MTLWQICLALFLLLFGALGISNITITGAMFVLHALAIATGILLFVKK